jgi:glycosyltransferase involved in cell wall biosynthesis
LALVSRRQRQRYRVALLVDEYFGAWNTAFGGYGALARYYICRLVPNDKIEIDVLLNTDGGGRVLSKRIDQTMVHRLPGDVNSRQRWLDNQAFNLFLSIEMTEPSFEIMRTYKSNVPLLFWIQDPRDLGMYQARRRTVQRLRDYDWSYVRDLALWLQRMISESRVAFISQGQSLSSIARKAYNIGGEVAIRDLPNPVEIDWQFRLGFPQKQNKIIFLGRLEAQKRVWIVCEVAKTLPQYEFYVLGATGHGRNEAANAKTLEPYRNPDGSSKIANLHFAGHVEGADKIVHIKTAKLLLNTSIWEGIPVSWLEALSYGTLIVSAFDRDNIVSRFGTFIGEVMGDGTDEQSLKRFAHAIEYWMVHDQERTAIAEMAIQFVRDRHSVDQFVKNMRAEILNKINSTRIH